MAIHAIGDLHLSHAEPKPMDVFGPAWKDHTARVARHWSRTVEETDLVLIPGDISWAMQLEAALPDLEWIGDLPGTKVMIKGNHDYWWKSAGKVRARLPDTLHIIQNDAFQFDGTAVAGTRLWQIPWVNSGGLAHSSATPEGVIMKEESVSPDSEENMRYVRREIHRLELSLQAADRLGDAEQLLVMLHYPPVDLERRPNEVTELLRQYGVSRCVYGHLHSLDAEAAAPLADMELDGIHYHLVSCDFTECRPVRII